MVFHTDRKLFAYSFLFGLAPLHFISAGNYSRKVSCPTWHHSISYRQETFLRRVSCPAWLHAAACPQETVRREISRLRFAPLEMTKGRGSMAFLTHRKLFAKGFLFALAPWRFLPTGNCSPGDFSTPLEMTKGRGSMVLLTYRKLFTPPLTPVNCPLAAAALFLYT